MDSAAGTTPGEATPPSAGARSAASVTSRRSSPGMVVAVRPGPGAAASMHGVSDDDDFGAHDSGSVKSFDENGDPIKAEGSQDTPDVSVSGAGSGPVQKRRRVTRACDECRRKKIKCDGRQPCTHCSVYSYECTYDKPSNRRRNPAPQYIEALENRLQRAETLLRKFMPDVDLADPKLDPSVQQEFTNRERQRAKTAAAAGKLRKEDGTHGGADGDGPEKAQDDQLMSMIETIGHLDLIDGSEWDFHGNSSGAVFLRRLKEQMGLFNHDSRAPFLPRAPRPHPGMLSLDSPQSSVSSPWEPGSESGTAGPTPAMYDLPPKDVAQNLCYFSLNCATCLLRIVHIPSFNEMVERLYEKGPENLGPEDHRPLGLLYAVMALGSMYTCADEKGTQPVHYKTAIEKGTQPVHYKTAIEKGVKYYTLARLLLQDITGCRDLVSLQALLFMILFLQATSNLSGCYAFLGIALRAALRMGLHRHLPHVQLTPVEDETRRRVFYAIRSMDTYVSALLGFPILLQDGDIDQPLPTEVDDDFITKNAILTPPPGTPSFFQAMNAHVRLMKILGKVIKEIYPMRGIDESVLTKGGRSATYMINYSSIKAIELDLQQWYEQLPNNWRPSAEGSIEVIRVRSLLRFSYAHVQMMLYRPFLHYVSPRLSAGKHVDERYYACAAACISVSRNIIHIGMEIRKQAVLTGPYWFILYTEFFAILSLAFYALENPEKAGIPEILADAHAGRELIASLSRMSLAADRVTDALNALFDQLPERLTMTKDQRPPHTVPTKKRSAPGVANESSPLPNQAQLSLAAQLKSETMARQQGPRARSKGRGAASRMSSEAQLPHRMSFDSASQMGGGSRAGSQPPQHQPFMSSFTEPTPLELLVASGQSPDAAAFRRGQQQHPGAGFQQVDAMMFPSADPFAYPSQPRGGGGGQSHHNADPMPFYMHHVYEDIEGQLLGPIPQYLMQTSQGGGGAASSGLDGLAAQMYGTAGIMSMQQQQQQQQRQHHAMGPGMAAGQQYQAQQQGMDDMLGFDAFSQQQYRTM